MGWQTPKHVHSHSALGKASSVVVQALEKKVPGSFERLAHGKSFVRYVSRGRRGLCTPLAEVETWY